MRTTILAVSMLVLLALASLLAAPVSAAKPNILIILSDDQGYADVGFQGLKDGSTPHLDARADAAAAS